MEHVRLYDYPFDFQEYIEKRLREFDDVEERKFAKAVLQDGLLNIIKETEKRYEALEKRVHEEIENDENKYAIRMTIIKKENYDPINSTWSPVLEEDLKGHGAAAQEVMEALSMGKSFRLGTVYVAADDEVCRALEENTTPFQGKLLTAQGEVEARFVLKKSVPHRKKIEELYALFNENSVPWTTISSAYLDKCFEIQLVKTETPFTEKMDIADFAINYGSYAHLVNADIIPLWNVDKIYYNCSQFPVPSIDTINYEHEFPTKEFGAENGFLVEKNEEIIGFRYEKEKIYVITPQATFVKWGAWRVVTKEPIGSLGYTYPVLGNAKQESFSKNYLRHARTALKTSADLYRKVYELGLEHFVRFQGGEIIAESTEDFKEPDMNWFIKDELFDKSVSRILLLKFQPVNQENYLNGAIVRYIVSEIQQSQSEYRCMGVLSEK